MEENCYSSDAPVPVHKPDEKGRKKTA